MMLNGISIKGITCDSRKVKNGYAFVAIKGEKEDGNDYIDKAIENGAELIYTEKKINKKSVPIIEVENSRIKLSELLNEFYDYPSEKLKLIGVTGTNGKTTTTHIIENILGNSGYKTGIIGTLGIRIDKEHFKSELTTPDAETMFYTLSQMVEAGVEVAIMEVSSHGLKLFRTYGLDFDVAIHTNITRDHNDFHKSQKDYLETKKILFSSLPRNRLAILNIDDDNATKLIESNDNVIVITYGLSKKATITASSLHSSNKTNFNLCVQRGITTIYGEEIEPLEFPLTLNLIGNHNVYNTLAAISTALYFGVAMDDIKKSLLEFKGVSRRLEKIYENEFLVLDDFSHNPASYEAVFEAIQGMEYNSIILVNAIRGSRGIEINEENANVIAEWTNVLGVKKVILSLSNDFVKEKDRVTKEEVMIYKQIFNSAKLDYHIEENLKNSISRAVSITDRDDIILLLGAQGMNKGKEILTDILKLEEKSIG
ncbi:Mur ligase family protein [Sporosalibacterium faouarense]|uniref:Mur ligase family protein n=1 Tax=Sporosalibacterium faouarense TaxID=516123 RepID=UPI00192B185A|nr:UDP-N-acetylmuramyl-tripeptide synthetase [Sporosalibacterium faouarense]